MPLAALTALRVLRHAADRTRPVEGTTDGPGGPGLSSRRDRTEAADETGTEGVTVTLTRVPSSPNVRPPWLVLL